VIQVTRKSDTRKPRKPRPDFPLFPHATDRWAKKVRGRLLYFGKVSTDTHGEAALAKWLAEKDYHLAALPVPESSDNRLTLRDLCNQFLTSKKNLVDSREITLRTFNDYHATCERILTQFGKLRPLDSLTPHDFETLRAALGRTWGPVAVGNEVNRVRIVFRYAFESGLIDKPIRFGQQFKRPSRRILRREREERGPRLFTAANLRRIIQAADVQLRAMVLLGINCGLGNSDCGQLRFRNIDLRSSWLNYPRPKTSVARRSKLWPETVLALQAAIDVRPEPKNDAHKELVFVTRTGKPWHKANVDNPIAKRFAKLLAKLGLRRTGLSFYALRHTTETIGGEVRDQVALNHLMGHAPPAADMASVYREDIGDDRLKAVADHVHAWLWPKSLRRKAR
jgi:integrase